MRQGSRAGCARRDLLLTCTALGGGLLAALLTNQPSARAACAVTKAPNTVTCGTTTTTNTNNINAASPTSSSAAQTFTLNGPVTGSILAGATVNGFGLAIRNFQSGANGAITFNNFGTVAADAPGAANFPALQLISFGDSSHLTTSGTVQGVIVALVFGDGSAQVDVTGGTVAAANSSNATVAAGAPGTGSAQVNVTGGTISGNVGVSASSTDGVVGVNLSAGTAITATGSNSVGIDARSSQSGSVVVASGANIGTQGNPFGTGMFASTGTGALAITQTGGSIVADRGIQAESSRGGHISVTTNAGSAIVASGDGVVARSTGGTVDITLDGSISAGLNGIVTGNTAASAASDSTVTVNNTVTGNVGLRAVRGTTTLINNGSITGTGGTALSVGLAGTLVLADGNGAINGNIFVDSNSVFAINRIQNFSYAGTISGDGSLRHDGAATTTLTGANTYTGGTTINAGTLEVRNGAALADSGAVMIANVAGARLLVTNSETIGSLAGGGTTGGTVEIASGQTLTTGGNNTSTEFAGVISGGTAGVASLIKTGTGNFTLSGNNTYSGNTILQQGTLTIAHNNALGIGTLITQGSVVNYNNGITLNNPIDLQSNDTQLQVLTGTATQAGNISETGGARPLEKIGAGTLILTGTNTYSGTTTIAAGTLQLGNGGTTGNAGTGNIVNNAALVVNRSNDLTMAQAISGTGSLTKDGGGNLTLSGNNTYTGGTTINGGTLQLGDATNTGTIRGAIAVNNATLDFVNANTSFITTIANNATGASLTRSTINFRNATNAGAATITSQGTGNGVSIVNFLDTSSAGASTVTLTGQASLFFNSNSRAGTATIVVNSDTGSQELEFRNNSSAESANITINTGGASAFLDSSTAANATITNNRSLNFDDNATAGNAIITTNSGAGTLFFQTASGGSARFITNAGGTFNISFLTAAGTTAGSIEGAGNYVLGNKSLTVGSNNLSTEVSGVISGAGGSLTKVGTGTLTLSRNNSYTGGTTISAGVLQIGNGGATGTFGTGNVVNNAALWINRSNNYTIDAVISGTGEVQQNGTGTTVLNGANTYFGATTVNAGALIVNGSVANSVVTVNVGATLGGNGVLGGLNVNGGTLSPGTSIGTITVQGSLVLSSAAAYIVEVNPSAADRTNVTGAASLAGTMALQVAAGTYTVNKQYVLVHADGGRTGTFTTGDITGLFGPAIRARIDYTANDAILNLAPNSISIFLPPSAPQNVQNVAGAIDQIFQSGNVPLGFLTLFNLSQPALVNTLNQLSGQHAAGGQQASALSMGMFLSMMLNPFADGRDGSFGAGLGFASDDARAQSAAAMAAFAAAMPVKAPPLVATFEQRWSVWGAAYGGRSRIGGDAAVGSNDLTANAGGFAAGTDYRVSPNTVLGLATAVGETHWNVSGLGKGRADVAQVGGYATSRWNDFYMAGAVAAAWHRAETDRTLNIAGTDRLEADFNATSLGARFEGGRRWQVARFGLTPYAAVQMQSVHLPAYSERATAGSAAFALTYASQTTTDTRSELGAWVDTRHRLDNGSQLVLRGRAAWVHDFNPGSRVSAAFQTLPAASFTVDGAAARRDSALTSAVAEFRLRNGVTLVGKFDGEFASGSSTIAGTGTLRYAW
jgi:autotransporter-associated beta strand protein